MYVMIFFACVQGEYAPSCSIAGQCYSVSDKSQYLCSTVHQLEFWAGLFNLKSDTPTITLNVLVCSYTIVVL